MKRLLTLLALLPTLAFAQQPPFPKQTSETKVTIAVTNTYQAAISATPGRIGCTIQNNGTHTMYVFFGTAAPADLTTSFQIAAGNGISCTIGVAVLNDAVWITGTANDVAVVTQQ